MNDLTLEKVARRRKHLVRYHLWDIPRTDDIDAWKQQFSASNDKKIAMIALDALIVRSNDSAVSSLFYMICSVVPKIIDRDLGLSNNYGAIPYDLLRSKQYVNKFRIQRLERDNPAGGQSSDNIIRGLRYTPHSVNRKYFEMADQNVPQVLLVDEFSGTGNQARDAILDWKKHLHSKIKITVFFMAIHKNGLKLLKRKFPDVKFCAGEILGDESSLLIHLKDAFQLDSIRSAIKMLEEFTKQNFIVESKIPLLGYGKMALCFKPPYTACNNMAAVYLLKTKKTNARLFERGL